MQLRTIGDHKVSAIGLGGMPMSIEGRPDEARSIATIHAALDAGITLIDTADAYHLRRRRGRPQRGADRRGARLLRRRHLRRAGRHQGRPPAPRRRQLDARRLARAPAAGVRGVAAAARRRGHRALPVPPARPEGALRGVGRRARATCSTRARSGWPASPTPTPTRSARPSEILGGRLVSVQNQFSPAFRSSEPELRLCDELGIAFLPWSPLGGIAQAADLGTARRRSPTVAHAHGVSPQQVTLAWMLAMSPVVMPIPGSSRPGDDPRLGRRRRPASQPRADQPAQPVLNRSRTPDRAIQANPTTPKHGMPPSRSDMPTELRLSFPSLRIADANPTPVPERKTQKWQPWERKPSETTSCAQLRPRRAGPLRFALRTRTTRCAQTSTRRRIWHRYRHTLAPSLVRTRLRALARSTRATTLATSGHGGQEGHLGPTMKGGDRVGCSAFKARQT